MTELKQPIILITNDDGITAPGIRALVETAIPFGKVVVVAPDSPQSGMGHAVSISKPLRLTRMHLFDDLGVEAYQCSGTPVDCVKMANDIILKGKPDYCFSGVNHGSNAAINVIYSGTMSAAMEAAIEGVPSAGFSSLDYSFDMDMEVPKKVIKEVMEMMLQAELPEHFLLNVNIPKIALSAFKGLKICQQGDARWEEHFIHRQDPRGNDYYWMTGSFEKRDQRKNIDIEALENNYASVVPITFDLTHRKNLEWMKENWKGVL